MELTLTGTRNRTEDWKQAGYSLPQYDIPAVSRAHAENPRWIHFGAGNIFRAFQANVAQELLNRGVLDTGLIAAEGYDYEIIEKMYRPHDNLSILATLKADGTVEKTVVGSIVESLILDSADAAGIRTSEGNLPRAFPADGELHHHGKGLQPDGRQRRDCLPDIASDFAQDRRPRRAIWERWFLPHL